MRGINKVILLATVTQDVVVKYAANGNAVANINVVTNDEWVDKATKKKIQRAEYHRVSIFGKLAEIAGQYVKVGTNLYLEGRLSTKKWQDKNGQDRYTTEVVLSGFDGTMQMLGGGGQQSNDANNQKQQGGQQQYQQSAQFQAPMGQQASQIVSQQQAPAYAPNDFDDDDVPF